MRQPLVSERLIILEGPDGAGKTRLARRLCSALGARYAHLGPFRGVSDGADLARLYVEAMMPAVLGYAPVVMDRSWLSEPVYGRAFRGGADRLGAWRTRVLERLAWRCEATVVYCLPSFDTCAANFLKNAPDQMLTRIEQLRAVYDLYSASVYGEPGDAPATSLPVAIVDPFTDTPEAPARFLNWGFNSLPASLAHRTDKTTAGNIRGAKALVVTSRPDWRGGDTLYQWPGGSFDNAGMKIVDAFERAHLSERDLYWAHPDDLTEAVSDLVLPVVALGGGEATEALRRRGREPDFTINYDDGEWRLPSGIERIAS